VNVTKTINYMFGRLDSLASRIDKNQIINGCDKEIIHSKLYNGEKPTIVLREEQNSNRAYLAFDSIRYDEQASVTKLFCGSNNFDISGPNFVQSQIVSFDLVDFAVLDLKAGLQYKK